MGMFDFLEVFKKKDQITGFGAIDTLGKVHMMVDKGMLEPLYLKAERFGGDTSPENRIYVPIGIAKLKEKQDDIVEELLREKKIDAHSCVPKYRGMSRIPYELVVEATSSDPEKTVVYHETISIW